MCPTPSHSATERSRRWGDCGRASSDLARWVAWLADAFPPRDDADGGPLRRASRREMQQVQRSFPTTHTVATGEGDEAVPARVDGGGYGFGLFVTHDTASATSSPTRADCPATGRTCAGSQVAVSASIALGNATYAPMSVMARRMLEIIDEHEADPELPTFGRAPALLDAAHRLAVLLSDWTDSAAHRTVRRQRCARRFIRPDEPGRPPS